MKPVRPMKKLLRISFFCLLFGVLSSLSGRAYGFPLALDSIREMGKFPRMCVDVYRWGDKFFNTYDTAYVEGTGYKFYGKAKVETWGDRYRFSLTDDYRLDMVSDPCTSFGLYLTYLAVSVGYDMNVSKIFGSSEPARKRFNFGFNCALFSAEFYWITNDVSTVIKQYGYNTHLNQAEIRFRGINTKTFGADVMYYFNNKRYSQAAAFNYSKVQKRSQGSFYAGLSVWKMDYNFNFNELPDNIKYELPDTWRECGYIYEASSRNYSLRFGYGYNWVFAQNWVAAVSESPIVGIKKGYINYVDQTKYSFSLFNRAKFSLVWTNDHWFAGGVLKIDNALVYDKDHSLINTVLNGEISVGYRFNLW